MTIFDLEIENKNLIYLNKKNKKINKFKCFFNLPTIIPSEIEKIKTPLFCCKYKEGVVISPIYCPCQKCGFTK